MTPDKPVDEASASATLDAELRKDLVKALATFLPTLLIVVANDWLKLRFFSQPAEALWVIIPGLALISLFYITTKARQGLKLGWPFLIFLSVYLLVFVVAAESRLLDWRRTLREDEDLAPRNFLALNRFGDWHYRFVSEKPNEDLTVVLMERPPSVVEGRLRIAELIALARDWRAKGVALDFHFLQTENGERLNQHLCEAIKPPKGEDETEDKPADSKGEFPVFVGYGFERVGGSVKRARIDDSLEDCLPLSRQGHAAGYLEWDKKMRAIPSYLGTNRSLKSLSLVVSEYLVGLSNQQIERPPNDLLQFTKPADNVKLIYWAPVWNNYLKGDSETIRQAKLDFQDHFILVGAKEDDDGVDTPYGLKPGVVIHAYAVHSLLQNKFIRRPGWWVTLPTIALVCYLLIFLMSRGAGTWRLIVTTAAFSVAIVAFAVLAMRFWLTWIDTAYPLIAIWLFLLLLLGLRRIRLKKHSLTRRESFS